MSKPLVVVTREVPGAVDIPGAEVRLGPAGFLAREQLLEMVRGAAVIISMFHDRVDAALLDAAGPQLRGIVNFAVGYDNIDVAECRRRGIAVANTPDAVTEGTANMAWALILAVARRVLEGRDRVGRFALGVFPRGGWHGRTWCWVNGELGAVFRDGDGRLRAVAAFSLGPDGDQIARILAVLNPDKLRSFERLLPAALPLARA